MINGARIGVRSARRDIVSAAAVLCSVFVVTSSAVADLGVERRAALLAEAGQAYDEGIGIVRTDPAAARDRFRDAARRYQLVIDDGVVNGRLYYNLANAFLQCGDVGPAILNYRRAEKYIPGDARLESNLEHARSQRRMQIAPSGGRALLDALLFWHTDTSLRTRTMTFAVVWPALWVLLLLRQRRPGTTVTVAAVLAACIAAPTGISVTLDGIAGSGQNGGVILYDDVTLRKGNGNGFEAALEEPLQAGVEFELVERRGTWWLIELVDGKRGWVRADDAGLVVEEGADALRH